MYQPRSSCNTAHSQGQEKLGPFMPAVPKTIQWKGTSLGTIPNMGTDLSAPLSRPTQQHSVALGNELWQSSHDSDGSCHPQSSCKHRQISVWHRSHPFQAATFNFNLAKHAKQEIKNRKYIYMYKHTYYISLQWQWYNMLNEILCIYNLYESFFIPDNLYVPIPLFCIFGDYRDNSMMILPVCQPSLSLPGSASNGQSSPTHR